CSLRDKRGTTLSSKQRVLRFESLFLAEASSKLDLSAKDAYQPRIFPGLLHEIPRSSPHGFDSKLNAAPGSHHNDGQRRVHSMNFRNKLETFFARGCVARVV